VFSVSKVSKIALFTALNSVDNASAQWGYESRISYSIQDQYNNTLPRRVDINEDWTTNVVADAAGMNWRRGNPGPATVNPANFTDLIQGETNDKNPQPQNPQNPLGNTAVYHWGQAWFVGSRTIGAGIRVQTDTIQKYRDHARHENIVSPP
jgi:hypothetical protein